MKMRVLVVCGAVALSTSALAQQWEEVVPAKNSSGGRYYFDKNVKAVGKNSVQTQYMTQESSPQQTGGRSYDKSVFRATIDCSTQTWQFSHRTYTLNGQIQLDEAVSSKLPAPPAGSAPALITAGACALR